MQGVPFRVEIGGREAESGELTVARRDNKAKSKVKQAELVAFVQKEGAAQITDLKKKASAEFESKLSKAGSMQELEAELGKGKLVAVPFCSSGKEGKGCADAVKEKTSGDVRGTRGRANTRERRV